MKRLLRMMLNLIVVGALHQAARAQIIYTSSTATTAWAGTPFYKSLPNNLLSTALTAQGDPAITGVNGVLAESFTNGTPITLGSFSLLMGVNSAGTYRVDLIDLGPIGMVSTTSATATYTPSGSPVFSDTIALPASGKVQGMFTLAGADQVTLTVGEEYALEILTPPALGPNGFVWYQNGTNDPGGQMFSSGDSSGARNTLFANGEATANPHTFRTAAMALYIAVPEPSMPALGALAFVVGMWLRRRKS